MDEWNNSGDFRTEGQRRRKGTTRAVLAVVITAGVVYALAKKKDNEPERRRPLTHVRARVAPDMPPSQTASPQAAPVPVAVPLPLPRPEMPERPITAAEPAHGHEETHAATTEREDAANAVSGIWSGRERSRRIIAARIILVIVFSLILAYAALSLVQYYGSAWGTESGINELRDSLVSPVVSSLPEETGTSESAAVPTERVYEVSERFASLYARNTDLIGWVKVDGTRIDYPVMRSTEDEQYYIDHNFDREPDENGLPFLDARCEIAPKNQIQLVYGHNIKSGIMFHDLVLYSDIAFWAEHQYISYDTIYDEAKYQIVAAFVFDNMGAETNGFQFHRFIEFPTESIFEAYKTQIMDRALYDTEIEFGYEDRYLILATCEYSTYDSRFVLLAKQV